jgi:REP element-mobilizing transposase RayT
MPRGPRPQCPGLTYHVFARGIRACPIYADDIDRHNYLLLLRRVVLARDWVCHAYCQMTNHYHLLVRTPEPNIAAGMQDLNSRYAEYFNRRHGYCGHLFQARYGSVVIKSDEHFLVEFRYVVRNPVRAGMCRRPDDWPWSSYRFTIGRAQKPDFLAVEPVLDLFATNRHTARQRLQAFVEDAAADEVWRARRAERTRPLRTRPSPIGV